MSYADKIADAMGEGFDSGTAREYADGSHQMPAGPTAEELLRDHFRHSYSVEEYDLLCAALAYLLPHSSEAERKHVAEILNPL